MSMTSSMKCFKIFFKRTWHPQQMIVVPSPASMWDYPYVDQLNSALGFVHEAGPDPQRELLPSAKNRIPSAHMETSSRFDGAKMVGVGYKIDETELGEVTITSSTPRVETPNSIEASAGSIPCGSGGCKSLRSRREPRPENPWHRLKTIFLVSIIAALIVWIVVYTMLSQYEIL